MIYTVCDGMTYVVETRTITQVYAPFENVLVKMHEHIPAAGPIEACRGG